MPIKKSPALDLLRNVLAIIAGIAIGGGVKIADRGDLRARMAYVVGAVFLCGVSRQAS